MLHCLVLTHHVAVSRCESHCLVLMRRVAAHRSELQRVAACSGGAVVCSFVCSVQRAACSGGGGVCSCSGGWWALLALTAGAPATVEVSRVTVGGETPAEKHLAPRLL